LKPIELKRVRYFLQLCDDLNFSSASKKLKISQPALTKSINQLEADLGAPLLRRERRITHLTPFGRAMLDHFRELDHIASRTELAAQRLVHGHMATLRVGLMCTIGPAPFADFMANFQATHSDVEIVLRDLHRAELADVLLSGDVDVAFVGAEIASEQRFRYTRLYEERMALACNPDHPLASEDSVHIEQVFEHPYVDRLQCEFRETFLAEANRRAFDPKFAARSDREEWAQALIKRGLGVALVPDRSLTLDGISLVRLREPKLSRTVSLAVPIGREDHDTVRNFVSAVKSTQWQ
jgi:LysR family hydrogen peroxide-inducible transcriptional activator